jgi:dipeptidase
MSVFVPWYLGINDSPATYQGATDRYDGEKTWWRFKLLGILTSIDYKELSPKIRLAWESQEKQQIDLQAAVEKTALELYRQDPAKARAFLTRYSGGWGAAAHETADELISECIRRLAELGK